MARPLQFIPAMYPTDPASISGIPSRERAITLGSVLGLSTVILGTTLLKISPLSRNHL